MKFMARILIAMLVIAMMFSVVGCGNTTQNGGNSNGGNEAKDETTKPEDYFYTEEDLQDTIEDVEYTPSEENLIGVAVYPIEVGTLAYTYGIGDLISLTESAIWRTMYVDFYQDPTGKDSGNVFSGNASRWGRDEDGKRYGEYQSSTEFLYLGYIYEIDGEIYILTTHDLVDFQNDVSVLTIKTIRTYSDGSDVTFKFTIRK